MATVDVNDKFVTNGEKLREFASEPRTDVKSHARRKNGDADAPDLQILRQE